MWNVTYDSGEDDTAFDVAVDARGHVYVTGESNSEGEAYDYRTIKYDSDGNIIWNVTYAGGVGLDDEATGVAIDARGYVYVTGLSENMNDDYRTIKYSQRPPWMVAEKLIE